MSPDPLSLQVARRFLAARDPRDVILPLLRQVVQNADEHSAEVAIDALLEWDDPKAHGFAEDLRKALKIPAKLGPQAKGPTRRQALRAEAEEMIPVIEGLAEPSPYKTVEAYLEKTMTRLANRVWWWPPHNYAISSDNKGLTTWSFRLEVKPNPSAPGEGITVAPKWVPAWWDRWNGQPVSHAMEVAETMVETAKTQPPVGETVANNMANMTRDHGYSTVPIPPRVKADLVRDAAKLAKRYWGVANPKGIFIPFE